MPMADDDNGVIFERLFLDKDNPNILHSEMTAIDNSLTRPWTVMKNYRRDPNPRPFWTEEYCENNNHVFIGKEHYVLSADGLLMPAQKDQPPPDLRYFKPAAE